MLTLTCLTVGRQRGGVIAVGLRSSYSDTGGYVQQDNAPYHQAETISAVLFINSRQLNIPPSPNLDLREQLGNVGG